MDYSIARIVNTIAIIVGYIFIIAGILAASIDLPEGPVPWQIAVTAVLVGMLIIVLGQMANAVIETAEQTRATARTTQKVLDLLVERTASQGSSSGQSKTKPSGAVASRNGIDLHKTGKTFVARGIVFNTVEQFYEWADKQ